MVVYVGVVITVFEEGKFKKLQGVQKTLHFLTLINNIIIKKHSKINISVAQRCNFLIVSNLI